MEPLEEDFETETDCFFVTCRRHDKDRLEINFGFDGLVSGRKKNFTYIADTALFAPKSLGLPDIQRKIKEDLQSYVRLHTHASNPKSETSRSRVEERLYLLETSPTESGFQNFAIDFQSFIKANDKKIRRRLKKLARRNLERAGDHEKLENLQAEILEVKSLIQKFRALKAKFETDKQQLLPAESIRDDFQLLDEYISHIFVQYIGDLFANSRKSAELADVTELLKSYAKAEGKYREDRGFLLVYHPEFLELGSDERANLRARRIAEEKTEQYSRRIALLKKYFQRPLYLKDSVSKLETKLLIPVYGLAAAMAASWAIMVQLYQVNNFGERMGINTIAFISVAVLGYVAKDILKDFMRRYLMRKGGSWLPSETHKLQIQKHGKDIDVGRIGESLNVTDSAKLAPLLRQWRYDRKDGKIEKALKEDVLFIRKKVRLNLKHLNSDEEFPWGFREVLRLRLDRFMTQMDDPYKNYHFINAEGIPEKKQTLRVYRLYLATWIKYEGKKHSNIVPVFKAFCITLNKEGILSCEEVKEELEEIPPSPDARGR